MGFLGCRSNFTLCFPGDPLGQFILALNETGGGSSKVQVAPLQETRQYRERIPVTFEDLSYNTKFIPVLLSFLMLAHIVSRSTSKLTSTIVINKVLSDVYSRPFRRT